MAKFGPYQFTTKSNKPLTLRHMDARDIDTYLVFQQLIAQETTNTGQIIGRPPEPSKMIKKWEEAASSEIDLRIGVFDSNRLVALLGFWSDRSPPHPWSRHVGKFGMMIILDYWGEGIGRKLLEIMEGHAKTLGITRIEALVRTKNERGIKLYKTNGYKIEGTREKAAFIDGKFYDEYFIAKLI